MTTWRPTVNICSTHIPKLQGVPGLGLGGSEEQKMSVPCALVYQGSQASGNLTKTCVIINADL